MPALLQRKIGSAIFLGLIPALAIQREIGNIKSEHNDLGALNSAHRQSINHGAREALPESVFLSS